MKKILSYISLLALSSCSMVGSGPSVPDKGTYISQITPRNDYQLNIPEQQLLGPNNNMELGVVEDTYITSYPAGIIDKLLAGWNGQKPLVKIFLVPSGDFTSDVSAGGAIFLTAGLLQYFHDNADVQTEDALAYTLAHELSHILLGHTDAMQRNKIMEGYLTGALEIGSIASNMFGGSALAGSTSKAIFSTVGAHEFINLTLFNIWSREQETQADILAIDLMVKAGYSTDEANSVIKVMVRQDEEAEKKKAARPDLVSVSDNKISLNAGSVASNYLREGIELAEMQHPFAKERLSKVSIYEQREYADQITDVKRSSLQKWLKTREMTRFLSGSKHILNAETEISAGNMQEAHKELSQVTSPVRDSVVWADLSSTVLRSQGKTKQAIALLESDSNRPDVTLPAVHHWAELLEEQKKYDEAEAYLKTEQDLFDNRDILPLRIKIAKEAKKDVLKSQLLMTCMASGNEALQKECNEKSK
jgi:predicted Zn-dependent protease